MDVPAPPAAAVATGRPAQRPVPHTGRDDRDPGPRVPDPLRPWRVGLLQQRVGYEPPRFAQPHGSITGLHHPHRCPAGLRHGPLVAGAGLLHRPGHGRPGHAGLYVGSVGRHVVRFRDQSPRFLRHSVGHPRTDRPRPPGEPLHTPRPQGHVRCLRCAGLDTDASSGAAFDGERPNRRDQAGDRGRLGLRRFGRVVWEQRRCRVPRPRLVSVGGQLQRADGLGNRRTWWL